MAVTVFILPIGVPLAATPTTIPGRVHFRCDTEAERPTPTNHIGHTAYSVDTAKNWYSDGNTWVNQAGTGGGAAWGEEV